MAMNKLTAVKVNQAKPGEKPIKLTDGGGMYLLIDTKGGKYWRFDYRFAEKRKTLALGTYPETTLEEARRALSTARKQLKEGSVGIATVLCPYLGYQLSAKIAKRALKGVELLAVKTPDDLDAARTLIKEHSA